MRFWWFVIGLIAVIAAFCLLCRPASADPFSSPPDISTTNVGTPTGNGTYLWQWDVFFGSSPSLSHFVLIDLCEEVWNDVVPLSLFGGTDYEFGPDPTTSTTGLKFEADTDDLGHGFFGFETYNCWGPTLLDVAFKSGQNVTFQANVVGPSCEPCDDCTPSNTPEPASLALLGLGVPYLLRRRLAVRKEART